MNQKAVIFDLDGVLIDTGQFHRQSWYDLAKCENLQMSDEFFRETFGMQNYQIIPKMTSKDLSREQIDELSEWKENRFRELIAGKLRLLNGAESLIAELKKNDFLLAIGTSTPRINLLFILQELPIGDYFDCLVTGEDVKNGKPAPDTFSLAAKKLKIEAKDCVVIEDAPAGVEAAKNAGMKAIAVTTTADRYKLSQADLIVDSLGELTARNIIKLLEKNDYSIPAIQGEK
ncbi:MAG: HAD family phosphatase [Phycisphaerae bacterium]|nr:HAD family phosphatase [Phycisphaerae bacterium]